MPKQSNNVGRWLTSTDLPGFSTKGAIPIQSLTAISADELSHYCPTDDKRDELPTLHVEGLRV